MRRKKALAWALCALWMGVIFAMSAMPGDVSGEQSGTITQIILAALSFVLGDRAAAVSPQALEWLVRKGAHMAEYAVLFLLYRRALRLSGIKRPGLYAFLMSVAYAATDEFHQSFVEDRGPGAVDVAIDALGAAAGWGISWILASLKRKE